MNVFGTGFEEKLIVNETGLNRSIYLKSCKSLLKNVIEMSNEKNFFGCPQQPNKPDVTPTNQFLKPPNLTLFSLNLFYLKRFYFTTNLN
jgi:hypothetical protein